AKAPTPQAGSGQGDAGVRGQPRPATEAGINRFVWDFRYADVTRFPGMILWSGETRGPRAVPGTYQVKLTAGSNTMTQSFEVKKDPRIETTQEEFAKQFDLLLKIRDKLTETHE